MKTILFGFQLGIGLILAYVAINVIGHIFGLIYARILLSRLKKSIQKSKPADLNFG